MAKPGSGRRGALVGSSSMDLSSSFSFSLILSSLNGACGFSTSFESKLCDSSSSSDSSEISGRSGVGDLGDFSGGGDGDLGDFSDGGEGDLAKGDDMGLGDQSLRGEGER